MDVNTGGCYMIHFPTPFALDKNLGRAYNNEFKHVAPGDYVCLRDYDTLFLLPDTIPHLYGYVAKYPEIDIFTCYANRNHISLSNQLLYSKVENNADIHYHIEVAQTQTKYLYNVTEIKGNIAGFFMLISKRLWTSVKFPETMKCFGVDFAYSALLRQKRIKIFRMDGVYIWHTYRLQHGVDNKKHLL